MATTDPVLIKMSEYVEKWKSSKDSRYVFLSCYSMMSTNMISAIDKREFHDEVWVKKLLNHFADYYFKSLTCYDCGDLTPKVWEYAHKATLNNELSDLQLLILGVNAHINYDLVFALYDMLKPEWQTLSEIQKRERYEDHCHVNHVIAKTIDRVQDEILEPLNPSLEWIDLLFGRMDEFLISRLIKNWRGNVWDSAQELLKIDPPEDREYFRLKLEDEVLKRADLISVF